MTHWQQQLRQANPQFLTPQDVWGSLAVDCKAFSLANAKRKGINWLVIRPFSLAEEEKKREWDLFTRDLQKPLREIKKENSFLWANTESQHRYSCRNTHTPSWQSIWSFVESCLKIFVLCIVTHVQRKSLSQVQQEKKVSSHTTTNPPSQMSNMGFQIQFCWWGRQHHCGHLGQCSR